MQNRQMIAAHCVLALFLGITDASAQEVSLRPVDRESVTRTSSQTPTKIRPAARPKVLNASLSDNKTADGTRFAQWVPEFRARAQAAGITGNTLDAAFAGVTFDPKIIKRDRNQSEFTKTIWDYLDSAASDIRISNGQAALRKHSATLDKIEAMFGVEKEVVVAIWGLESAYGTFRGGEDVVQSLATLAFDARRSAFFEQQLIAALKILQNGDTRPRDMTGSWAGAMGHTQFIPTSYLDYAVDFTGDGKRDIWSDDPTDALASTAAYLAKFGWQKGMPWGVEVTIPTGFDYALANRKITKQPSDWRKLGVTGMRGNVRDYGPASVLLPTGGKGAAFLVFQNFDVIERYNTADAYIIGVGHLSDRIKGEPAIQTPWPREDRALTLSERKEMQRALTRKGFDTKGIDGKIGPKTIDAVRGFQASLGMPQDGYASLNLLKRLR